MFQVVTFWVMIPCSDVVGYRRFGKSCCLRSQRMEVAWSSEKLVSCYITTTESEPIRPRLGSSPRYVCVFLIIHYTRKHVRCIYVNIVF